MPKFFVSFGQSRTHRINGKTFDCAGLMELIEEDYHIAYERAFELTEGIFGTLYTEEDINKPGFLDRFPLGIRPL